MPTKSSLIAKEEVLWQFPDFTFRWRRQLLVFATERLQATKIYLLCYRGWRLNSNTNKFIPFSFLLVILSICVDCILICLSVSNKRGVLKTLTSFIYLESMAANNWSLAIDLSSASYVPRSNAYTRYDWSTLTIGGDISERGAWTFAFARVAR